MGIIFASEPPKPVSVVLFRPYKNCANVEALLCQMPPSTQTLDLSDIVSVDDYFIAGLVTNEKSARLVNLRLSGTRITEKALELLLRSSTIGSVRDLPIRTREKDCAHLYLDVHRTLIRSTAAFVEPVPLRIHYTNGRHSDGIKILHFSAHEMDFN